MVVEIGEQSSELVFLESQSLRSTSRSDDDKPGHQRPFRRGFHALRRVLLRQANDAKISAVAHFRVWLGAQDSFEQ